MSREYRFQPGFTFVSSILLAAIVLLCSSIPLHAAQAATTKVRHKTIPYFVPGSRIAIDARVTDESGVFLVRCYFKADMQAEYVFVPMQETSARNYQAVLPAPADYAEQIEYLFLVVNNNRQVVKTQEFQVSKALDKTDAPDWQKIDAEETIRLYTEMPAPPETVAGFSDSVTMDTVESSLRFGMVAGVYSSYASGSAGTVTGVAASSTSAGSITAATGTYTTIALATIAGVAAGAGAIASSRSSGGSGGNGDKATINPSARITWGDDNIPPADTFQAIFGREDLGSTSGTRDKSGLPVGIHDLTIRAVSITGEFGSAVVVLGGGAYFHIDGSTRKTAQLAEGQSIVFPVFVPETGSGRIEW